MKMQGHNNAEDLLKAQQSFCQGYENQNVNKKISPITVYRQQQPK